MALTEIYVDPSIAADSGDGSIGSPYGDLEYAIEQETFDTTNGTRVNIKAGTDEVLAADLITALSDTGTSAAWAPVEAAPLVFQGYTAAAGDGGIGGISGGAGNFSILTADGTRRYVTFADLHLHNTGSDDILNLNNWSSVVRCELDNSTGRGIVLTGLNCYVVNNYIHNIGGSYGIQGNTAYIGFNYLENGANNFSTAAILAAGCVVENNIVVVDSTSDGIISGDPMAVIKNNSIFSDGGTGSGISCSTSQGAAAIINNLIEGFSGVNAKAIEFASSTTSYVRHMRNNSWYNCTSGIDTPGVAPFENSGNEELTASPFTDAANGDFSPVDTGSVKEGSWPTSFTNS